MMNLLDINQQIQRIVTATPDGIWGLESAAKTLAFLQGKAPELVVIPKEESGDYEIDERSERNIATLLPPVQEKARALLKACHAHGINMKITSGSRTYAEQDELYAQG